MTEHQQQVAVIEHCDLILRPEIRFSVNFQFPIFAVPNAGKRSIPLAMWLKAEGLRSGVPDLFVPIPADGYHGLFIEMKDGRKKPSPEQQKWIDFLNSVGYHATVCFSAEHAIDTIRQYLKQPH